MKVVITPDFPGYELYSDGRIYSRISNRFLKPLKVPNGYTHVVLTKRGVKKRFSIHRLILTGFLGQPASGMVANHKNGNKTDNRLENLEWVTQSENVKSAYISGQRIINKAHRDRCAKLGRSRAKTTKNQRAEIKRLFTGQRGDISRISREMGLSRYIVSYVIKGV